MRVWYAVLAMSSLALLASCTRRSLSYKDNPVLTPLMNAAAHHDVRRVESLLVHGADVGQRTADGETALYEAIEDHDPTVDNLPTVDALLKAGADPNQPEIYGASPLDIALTRDAGNTLVVPRLLQAGARVPRVCGKGDSLLSLEVQDFGDLKIAEELIRAGAPINCRDGGSALYRAAVNGEADMVQLLLKYGADPEIGDPKTVASCPGCASDVRARFAKTRQLLTDAQRSRPALGGH
jgi:ankyrin repeat protein